MSPLFRHAVRSILLLSLWLPRAAAAAEEDGKTVQLVARTMAHGEFDIARQRGKLTLIAVWATWCPICLGELPELNRIYQQYHPGGLEMIALNIDDDEARLKDYLQKKQFSFPVARRKVDEKDNLEDLGVTPVFYLVGKDGKVIWRRVGPVVAMLRPGS